MSDLMASLIDQAIAAAVLHDGEQTARDLEHADHEALYRGVPRVVRQVALPRPLPEPVMPAGPLEPVCDHGGRRAARYATSAADLDANPLIFRCDCGGLLNSPLYDRPAEQALDGLRSAGQTGA